MHVGLKRYKIKKNAAVCVCAHGKCIYYDNGTFKSGWMNMDVNDAGFSWFLQKYKY